MEVSSDFMVSMIFGNVVIIFVIIILIIAIIVMFKGKKRIKNPEYAKNVLIQNGFSLADITSDFAETGEVLNATKATKNDMEIYMFNTYPNASAKFIDNIVNSENNQPTAPMMTNIGGSMTTWYTSNGKFFKINRDSTSATILICNEANKKEINDVYRSMFN